MAATPGWLDVLTEREALDAGERLFLERAMAARVLTQQNAPALLDAHRAGSRKTWDQAADREAVAGPLAGARRSVVTREVAGTPAERERARVFSRHVARLLTADQGVRMFRRSLLGSPTATLPRGRAHRLLASRAVAVLSWTELRNLGVPLDGTHGSDV